MLYSYIDIYICRPAEASMYVSVAYAIPNVIWDSESIDSLIFYPVAYKPTTHHLSTNSLFYGQVHTT